MARGTDTAKHTSVAKRDLIISTVPDSKQAMEQMFYISGEIPRVTPYERGFPPQVKLAKDGNSWEPDPLVLDERRQNQ
jgi:7,8-dihydropterin-6-yl-methyl-4-(beta-D-ribofuranosyl)aminobenzene 5'-phosphate synthase